MKELRKRIESQISWLVDFKDPQMEGHLLIEKATSMELTFRESNAAITSLELEINRLNSVITDLQEQAKENSRLLALTEKKSEQQAELKDLWKRVVVAYTGAANSVSSDRAGSWADTVCKQFAARYHKTPR